MLFKHTFGTVIVESEELGTMTAATFWPQTGSSIPTTATSAISGCESKSLSTCRALILYPP